MLHTLHAVPLSACCTSSAAAVAAVFAVAGVVPTNEASGTGLLAELRSADILASLQASVF